MDQLTETDHQLDPIRRLRILAAALPDTAIVERLLDAPYDAVWAIAGDLEGGVQRFEGSVTHAKITARHGERLALLSYGRFGPAIRFEVLLRPGWCWMQSRLLIVGMAALREDDQTRFAHLEGTRLPGGRLVRPLIRRKMRHELDIIEQLAQAPCGPRSTHCGPAK